MACAGVRPLVGQLTGIARATSSESSDAVQGSRSYRCCRRCLATHTHGAKDSRPESNCDEKVKHAQQAGFETRVEVSHQTVAMNSMQEANDSSN